MNWNLSAVNVLGIAHSVYYRSIEPYIHRLVGDQLMAMTDRPVVVLEGARAVGKTTLARRQLEPVGFGYSTLEDAATRQRAEADLASWLHALALPAIIDEAQLVPGLPLELKRYVDTLGPGCHFVLTGSASISRTGLGGTDPLVRRSARLTMHPLTAYELAGQRGSLVDALFEYTPMPGERAQASDAALMDALRLGGLPGYASPAAALSRARLRRNIGADMTTLLSSNIAPGLEFNPTKARTVLDALLREPGGILNATALGNHLGIDRRTVERHVDIFARLFLLQWLPNLGAKPTRQDFARAKMHAVDTSFAADALERAAVMLPDDRTAFGKLLETHVVAQLMAHAQWATLGTTMHYWRQAGTNPHEVDLVLADETERLVAVEVKAATSVTSSDLKGMRALGRVRPLHRGFVFYRGSTIQQLGENIWALPMSVLGDATAFLPPGEDRSSSMADAVVAPHPGPDPVPGEDARVFLSYVRSDDEHERGRIVAFAHDLVETYSFLYGGHLQLFVDREGIPWGRRWAEWLTREAGAATFLLAVVTPAYLRSDACRGELEEFTALAARNRQTEKLLLPLMWVEAHGTPGDPVWQRIQASEYEDVTTLWQLEPGSTAYVAVVRKLAGRLKQTIDSRTAEPPLTSAGEDLDAGPDMIDLWAHMEPVAQRVATAVESCHAAVNEVGAVIAEQPGLTLTNPRAAQGALIRLAHQAEAPRRRLVEATADLTAAWSDLDALVTKLVALPLPDEWRLELRTLLGGLTGVFENPGAAGAEQVLKSMSSLSRQLRPLAASYSGLLELARNVAASADAWSRTLATPA